VAETRRSEITMVEKTGPSKRGAVKNVAPTKDGRKKMEPPFRSGNRRVGSLQIAATHIPGRMATSVNIYVY
jgi:hypothetical protein